jgi:hypothetical protein
MDRHDFLKTSAAVAPSLPLPIGSSAVAAGQATYPSKVRPEAPELNGHMRQEFVPLSNVPVCILAPDGRGVKAVHLVRFHQSEPFTVKDGYAELTIPSLHGTEIVYLELS